MSKRTVILNIENCGDYSVIGALAKYWGGSIPRGFMFHSHKINCTTNDLEKVREQSKALGMTDLTIVPR